jgi:hypothetical protein
MTIFEKLQELIDNNPIYVQVGFNRFPIRDVTKCDNCILINIEDDADNPIESYDFSPQSA